MPIRALPLPGPITLVPGSTLERQLSDLVRNHPSLPAGVSALIAELNRQTAAGGVPATLDPPNGRRSDWSLLLYTRISVTRLFVTKKYGDAYTIASVNPLRIRDHHRLADGFLALRPPAWEFAATTQALTTGTRRAYWRELNAAWQSLSTERAAPGTPTLSLGQRGYLDTLDRLIDATERIDTEAHAGDKPFAYRSFGATGGRRYGAHPVYEFRVAGGRLPDEGAFVQLNGDPEQRGEVTRVVDDRVTVRFAQAIDYASLPPQGQIQVTPSTVVFKKQREAVGLLRDRSARNPYLLSVLVDHRVRPQRPVPHRPAGPLDEDQEAAFVKALGTDDLFLVIGPPGTGKTRTITEITRAAATTMGRVLVTSHTNRAVDNVLAGLPGELLAIRVGNESKVTAEGWPYLLEQRAAELRTVILNTTEQAVAAYGDLDHAGRWLDELGERIGTARSAAAAEAEARADVDRARRAAGGPAQLRVDELAAAYERAAAQVRGNAERADRLARRLERARDRARRPLIGVFFAFWARRTEERLTAERELGDRLRADADQAAGARTEAERHLEQVTRADPAVRTARAALDTAATAFADRRTAALEAARSARSCVLRLDTPPPLPDDPAAADEAVVALHTWLTARLPLLRARSGLLGEWRDEVSGATEQLYPELIRYANVVAATCIGAASRPELADVEFDLGIVDEAGQIGVPDVLVPLVRARRGVLVGDHNQLPPFLDSDVEFWGKSAGDPLIRDLLKKSALEQLVEVVPAGHHVMLTRQRRMPAVLADFISAQFYEKRLRTAVDREHRDPIFRAPIAFADTARLPEAERTELDGRAREEWGRPGYTNPAEADLLARLAAFYHRRGVEWAVIVPYKAQLGEIKKRLTAAIGNAELVGLNVGTVDAFQGGERDVILYGFTRSNRERDVGFLRELRRANVAFTRAKEQLVMVGDLDTLTHARHAGFRDLARALRDHLADHGDLRPYAEIMARLEAAEGES